MDAETAIAESMTPPRYAFQISLGELVASSLFQSSDETRVLLAKTRFEIVKRPTGHIEVTLVATNGRILSAYNREVMPSELFYQIPDADTFCVDLADCKKLPKSKLPDDVTVSVFDKHVDFTSGSFSYRAQRDADLDAKYPEWRKVIPTDAPDVKAIFAINSEYVHRCGKAVKLVADSTTLMVRSFGDGKPVVVTAKENRGFFAVIMPVVLEEWPEAPEWLKEAVAKKDQKKAKE